MRLIPPRFTQLNLVYWLGFILFAVAGWNTVAFTMLFFYSFCFLYAFLITGNRRLILVDEERSAKNAYLLGQWVIVACAVNLFAYISERDLETRLLNPVYAIQRGDLDSLGKYLDGVEINPRSPSGSTPLHGAAFQGKARLAHLLLSRGAEVNAADNKGNTPLHLAALHGRRSVVTALLEQGADRKAKNGDGLTPGDLAHQEGYADMAKLLETTERTR